MSEITVIDPPKLESRTQASDALPTVSFVVTNYNYGEFVNRCLMSIFHQKYPNIECVIVDDASTDGSLEIIKAIEPPAHRKLLLVTNSQNLGQTRACIEGFKKTSGHYVAFIDADDELDPDYALAHVWAHFSSRRAIGFSSCDLAVYVNGQMVLNTVIDDYFRKKGTYERDASEARPLNPRIAAFFSGLRPFKLRYVEHDTLIWPWAPTTGNVYRRDAAALFLDNPDIGKLPYATDAYLNYGINSITGSVLIDEAFGIYHIHKRNFFTQSAGLASTKNFASVRDFGTFAARCALEHIIERFDFFSEKLYTLKQLDLALRVLSEKASHGSFFSRRGSKLFGKALRAKWRLKAYGIAPEKR